MTFELDYVFSYPQIICYDGEGEGTAVSDPPASGDPPANDDQPDGQKKEAVFTQAQLNEILAADRRKHQDQTNKVKEQAQQLEAQMQKLIQDKNTTEAAKASLQADLDELRASQLTEEQKRELAAKKAKEEHENQVKNLQEQATQWETLFKRSTIERTLTDAAVTHDAFSPSQIVSLLKDHTEMKPVKDSDGNEIPGRFEPKTAIKITEENGEVLTAWKTPAEAVEHMKTQSDLFGNLFKNHVIAGIGSGTAPGGGKPTDPSKLSIEEKARRFREDPESLGLKPKRNY